MRSARRGINEGCGGLCVGNQPCFTCDSELNDNDKKRNDNEEESNGLYLTTQGISRK